MRFLTLSLGLLFFASTVRGADEWQPVATELLAKETERLAKQKEKLGFGGLSGVAVDRATGTLYVSLSDDGVFSSTDQGKTWERYGKSDKDTLRGRTETPGCFQLDPTDKTGEGSGEPAGGSPTKGKRFVLARVYGGPVILGATDSDSWRSVEKKCQHIDWYAPDWSDPEMKFALAYWHEKGGILFVTRDGGKSFIETAKGYGLGAWVFDGDIAVVALAKTKEKPKGGIVRTTDGGKTFEPVAEYVPIALPKPQGDLLFWLVEGALLKGTSKGAKWAKVSDIKDARYGPIFGKDAKTMFVLTSAGVIESADGGATWSKPIAVPKELKGVNTLTWLDYDPKNDTLYLMKMGSDLYKLQRAK